MDPSTQNPLGYGDSRQPELRCIILGAVVVVRASDDKLLRLVRERLPCGTRLVSDAVTADATYTLCEVPGANGRAPAWRLFSGVQSMGETCDLDEALHALDCQLEWRMAVHARGFVLVHAGVVGSAGLAIVIPGRSMSGKSTLVAALLRRGALYYSDEYAVLDEHGHVRPFPRPLRMRVGGGGRLLQPAEAFGAQIGRSPLPVALIICARHAPRAGVVLRRLSPTQSVLELVSHTAAIRLDPDRVLARLGRVAAGAATLAGTRGDADAFADMVMQYPLDDAEKGPTWFRGVTPPAQSTDSVPRRSSTTRIRVPLMP
jgi:hypothetical protein